MESEVPTPAPSPRSDETDRPGTSRRQVIATTVGAVAFSFWVVGAFGGSPDAQTQIGGGNIRPACLNEDDGGCSGPDGDCDASQPVESDRDESCGEGDPGEKDEACQLVPSSNSANSSADTDENCGNNNDRDQACGDCNDSHDEDQNCGGTYGAGVHDKDEDCGHAHYASGDNDGSCSATSTDEGCGDHNTNYNVDTFNDTDEHCASGVTPGTTPDSDQNCSSQSADATCNAHSPDYSTSPDESCSSTDTDNACGAGGSVNHDASYDRDESCGNSNADESCGAGGWLDGDENCDNGGDPDNDA